MQTQPAELSTGDLTETVRRHWGRRIESLRYLPVGAGSHHWAAVDERGGRWFLTVDDLRKTRIAPTRAGALAVLARAWQRAARLREEAGLDFVLAPQQGVEGALIRPVDENFAVTVFPHVDAEPVGDGGYADEDERGAVVEMVARLHAVPQAAPMPVVGVPGREELAVALDARTGWDTGPYGPAAGDLLHSCRDDVVRAFAAFDRMAGDLAGSGPSPVLTHGEPHSANVLRRTDGRLLLIDWDTVDVAARERDLATVLPGGESDRWWPRYRQVSGAAHVCTTALRLYDLWWDLAEICEYVGRFRRPHRADADHDEAWRDLQRYLPVNAEFLTG